MKEILSRLIDDFHERDLPSLVPRHVSTPEVPGKANVVIGMRRAGKTWFCYQRMQELMAKGTAKERILYVNFEDERLLPFSAHDFQEILETYYRKFPQFKNQTCHLFLDEVHRIGGWDRFVRRILDSENLKIWVTGSSSKLLGSEIATSLRGRSLTIEIFPFSFKECLQYHGVELKRAAQFGSKSRASLQHMAVKYIAHGGFPEVQSLDDETRRQIHRNYLDVVILRDIVERHAVSNTPALRTMIHHLMVNPATRFSVNRFYNSLKSQGVACTKNDLYLFLDYLMASFLIYPVSIHSRSAKARQLNPKKIYTIDTGLLNSVSFQMTEDRGALLENLVFMHLRRRGSHPEYYMTETGSEIDFLIPRGKGGKPLLIQVCWRLDRPEAKEREEASLQRAMKELGVRRGTIITWLDEGSLGKSIEVIPAWKWLLSE